ncbi:MAG: hypothetical protein CSB47_05300 [Proteobacteria bacterium]|nr:MAG: hypothetical protein CSB47_05300 [Pseudomonadota bacterium]
MSELLFLLLPIAFYSGWRAAGKSVRRQAPAEKRPLSDNFVKGVNYLLSEEPDKALDVFLNRPEIDEYTAETYLLLGNLFRNRGEVDRALSVHQNLIGRASLSRAQKSTTMLALGKDFLAAGMMDRAERVFTELLQSHPEDVEARRSLRNIYEQTLEWEKAIEVTQAVHRLNNENVGHLIANYYCELADIAIDTGHLQTVHDYLVLAEQYHPQSTRTTIIRAHVSMLRHQPEKAGLLYLEAAQHSPGLLGMIFPDMVEAYQQSGRIDALQDQLFEIYQQSADVKVLEFTLRLAIDYGLSELVKRDLPDLLAHKQLNVRTISKALTLFNHQDIATPQDSLQLVDQAISNHLLTQPGFQCQHCGYKMHDYLWRCPACSQWDEITHI